MAVKICYCFNYTDEDIRKDVLKNGRSLIMEMIMREKSLGNCDCANQNPNRR
ncbi:MAG: BFD-like (2Fe-2S) protein [Deltaproteobacteria bacterium]|nr:MAG: BFD-like (2Fe-2S) protein [Deltaproteobacteria bacterium]